MLEKQAFKFRKERESAIVSGPRGSVELNAELDALIAGQETREMQRENNQKRYSQVVGTDSGETLREINERRLLKGKDSGDYGREKEMGFVVDLIGGGGGCGMCVGEVLVL
jgi:hypothetical protein